MGNTVNISRCIRCKTIDVNKHFKYVELKCGHKVCFGCLSNISGESLCIECPQSTQEDADELKQHVLQYVCNKHTGKRLEFFCLQHKELLCSLDLLAHNDHFQKEIIKVYQKQHLQTDLDNILIHLSVVNEACLNFIESLVKIDEFQIRVASDIERLFQSIILFVKTPRQLTNVSIWNWMNEKQKKLEPSQLEILPANYKFNQQMVQKMYVCDFHPQQEIEYFCTLHKELLCSLDLIDHSSHFTSDQIVTYTKMDLEKDIIKTKEMIVQIISEIDVQKRNIQEIKSFKTILANDLLLRFKNCFQLLRGLAEPKSIQIINLLDSDANYTFLLNKHNRTLIQQWLPLNLVIGELLWKGSTDGYECDKFHGSCDPVEGSITIIRSTLGLTFGGVTTKSWSTAGMATKYDDNAFIFSIDLGRKFNVKPKQEAITCNIKSGPCFGIGDLTIADKCNVQKSDCGLLGVKYELGEEAATLKGKITGGTQFLVEDIEVYSITTPELQ